MNKKTVNNDLINEIIAISKYAGKSILEIYNSDFDYELKEDASPLTEADKISHQIIVKGLSLLNYKLPIISEEDSLIPFNIRSKWRNYWLIDPLDGTKEFIKRNGEFTVNIALIENNVPILGIIHIPVLNETYWGSIHHGSYHQIKNKKEKRIYVSTNTQDPLRILTSRSHPSKTLTSILKEINNYEIILKGSSIKFCLIASGMADIYPRFGPTSEWDSAAGEAIIKFAGGHIATLEKEPLTYNLKESYLNPNFIASNGKILSNNFINLTK